MSLISSMFGQLPGMGTVVETFESAFCWGPYPRYWAPGYIDSAAADPTNTPTWELRMGLVMGKKTATGTWTNYSATATDGSQVAQGVLPINLRMQDILTGVNLARNWGIMVSGGVQASKLIGLDGQARAQMADKFYFDDNLPGDHWYPFMQWQAKTANYAIVAADNMTVFTNIGATGEVDFTLPPIASGYWFGFRVIADHEVKVISNEGGNLVAFNNAAANSVEFAGSGSTAIGGGFNIYSDPSATYWIVQNAAASQANIVTVN